MKRVGSKCVIAFFCLVLSGLGPAVESSVPTCGVFPADNIWNAPVDKLPLDSNSAAYVETIGANATAHPDFGSGDWPPGSGSPIGIPYITVPGTQPKVPVSFDYLDESDPGPYPIPANPPIEGGPQGNGDRHILVIDSDNCVLYELYYAFPQTGGTWYAGSGAIFDLKSNALRPAGWTSADAAGFPIFPGLVRYDEVASGEIRHAVRFTAPETRKAYVWPARHYASSLTGQQYPPMGQRFRLKAAFDVSGFSPQTQVILNALKRYGMMLSDNGSAWYISGAPDPRWNNDVLHELSRVQGSDFEAVDVSSLMICADSAAVKSIPPPSPPPGTGPDLGVDAGAGRHAISEGIYGMNFAGETLAADLRVPVRRWGGNSTTRYNWQTNMHNTGSDWYYENIPDGAPVADGSASDLFVEQDRRTGTKTIMTVPLIGWSPSGNSPRNHPYDCGYKVSKYGTQQTTDPWDTDCGNGIRASGGNITGDAPGDTSVAIGPTFVLDWVSHLSAKYGLASNGGVAYYDLDNEPMLWNGTHRDVHPQATTYDELRDRTISIATGVKTADPTAQTLGPVLWGWCAYFYSALDGCGIGNDYSSHGNTPFVPWYLQQMQSYEHAHGVRILDYMDLHYYPQASGVSLSPAGDAATQALRLRSTRSLWDSSYMDESWISSTAPGGVAVRLIPRMKEWVDANYPGTKLAITEYNWGALDNINGALAQADVLGIFGREGLDLATLWAPPGATDPGAFAFRMYRNYDGAGGGFGGVSTMAVSAGQDTVSIYAAQRSADNALTIMVINKTSGTLTSTVGLSNFNPQPVAAVYRYSGANLGAIQRAPDLAVTTAGFSADFPGNSITLFVLMPTSQPPPVTVAISPASATTQTGNTQQFTSSVSGTSNTAVTWNVSGITGGNATVGTVSASGLYTAPANVPNPAAVTVTCVSNADTTKSASATVTVLPAAAFHVLTPNGGEILTRGQTYTISWTAPATATAFRLQYSTSNGKRWAAVTPVKVTGRSYLWKVPMVISKVCLVKVNGYDTRGRLVGTAQSQSPFTIR